MKKEIYLIVFLLMIAFGSFGQISAVFVADDSENADNSQQMYELMKASLPSMSFFNAVDSARSPKLSEITNFDLVVWYSGSDNEGLYFWNGNKATNPALIDYLDSGGSLWVMGSGFLNDRFTTAPVGFDQQSFVWKYLGIKTWFMETFTDDGGTGVPQLDKTDDTPVNTLTLDTINWKNPPEPFVDGCKLTPDASSVYELGPLTYPFTGNFAGFYLKGDGFNNITFTFDPATMNTPEKIETLFSGTIDFYQDLLSGIDEQKINSRFTLNVYPNPASVWFKAGTNLKGKVTYKLLDLTGSTLIEVTSGQPGNNNEIEIPVGSLSPGMYFLMADNGSVRLSKKVMVSR
ncbi:MAG: T9SS type A sorting domain-containing protein [Chlorobi bacterium]|nr:T9SS type A sorting domain-containing protein [Chlorobiota bacterium]